MTRRSTPHWKVDDHRFPVRVRVAVPPGGFGVRLNEMHAWLADRVGRDGYGTGNDAGGGRGDGGMLIYLDDLAVAAELLERFGLTLLVRRWRRARTPNVTP